MSKTKRPDNLDFAGLYEAILSDYLMIYPGDQLESMRDSKRIALELRSRGLSFLTIDLPAMGKVLDQALARGRLPYPNLPCFGRRWKGSPIPKLFSGLWIRLFDRSGQLREDVDPDVVFYLRTLLYTCKKLNLDCKPNRLYETTKEYYDVDSQIQPAPSDFWNGSGDLDRFPRSLHSFYGCRGLGEEVQNPDQNRVLGDVVGYEVFSHVQRVAGVLGASLGLFCPSEALGRHGPGAVSEELSWGTKYVFPSWSPRLEAFFPWDYHGVTTVDNFLQDSLPIPGLLPREEEAASKLCAVPKTQKGPRLIASEPVANQWVQQGVANLLRERVRKSPLGLCIDFFDQEPSRADALAASRHGRRSTIDLSSASDRLSCTLVEQILGSNLSLLRLLSACRTRFLSNSIDVKQPKLLKLRKYASMGSALTFPIQSIVFAILAVGVGKYLHPKRSIASLCKEVRVFGDDIIIPNHWVSVYTGLLSDVGLKVNLSKTFVEGNFRESCGMDAFAGYDVTPPYVRWPTAELTSRSAVGYVAVANNFFLKGCWRTAKFLDSAANWMQKLPVVNHRAAALGRATFCNGLDPSIPKVWDKDTQQWAIKIYRVIPRKMKHYQIENPNGMMEYSVSSRNTDYSWKSLLSPRENYFPLSTLHELPADGSTAVVRRRLVSLATFVWCQGEEVLSGQ